MPWGYPCHCLLVKATEEMVTGSSDHFCTSCCQSSLELISFPTFFSKLSYFIKILSLTNLHITLIHCNNPVTLFPSSMNKPSYIYLTWMNHLSTPCNNLKETSLTNVDCSWFTNGSYLKNENGKYCTGYSITTPFEVLEAVPLLLATSARQVELYSKWYSSM